ncbi:MAG: hypothetical protein HY720_29285 [Planctomycetes bacterium]|nr:hypothetical protein [Planctomycetota bacterium]
MASSPTAPAPKPARQIGCLKLLAYGYAIFALAVVGTVVTAHYKRKALATKVLDGLATRTVDEFMDASRYDIEKDPDYIASKKRLAEDRTLVASRRATQLDEDRTKIWQKRKDTLAELAGRLVTAHEEGRLVDESILEELDGIRRELEEMLEHEKTDYKDFERIRTALEGLLAKVEKKTT